MPIASSPLSRSPEVEPPPVSIVVGGARKTELVDVGTGVGLALALGVGLGLGLGDDFDPMCVVMLVRQVSTDPPGLPVPLHWLTVIGIAALIRESELTAQFTVPPPPLPEPLHSVTVALVV
jgi:hypothetical protein